MAKYKQPDPEQGQFVVLNFSELFPEDHPVPRLLETIRSFDLSKFDQSYSNDSEEGGRPAAPVDRILALIVYALLYGNLSMRALERDIKVRADLMYLSGGMQIDHSTLAKFRLRHADAIKDLFTQTLFLGVETGLIDLDTVSIDSTKIKASANRRDIGTKEELERRYRHIEEACKKRYQEWENAESSTEKELLASKMEKFARHKEKLAKGLEFLKDREEKKRIHLTDPDADWHKDGSNRFIVGYATQNAVDYKSGMIIYQEVVTAQGDPAFTVDIINSVERLKNEILPEKEGEIKYVLDCGYASEKNLEELGERDVYLPDREFAHKQSGGKIKPEERKDRVKEEAPLVTANQEGLLEFIYDREKDAFLCPAKQTLKFIRDRELQGALYREYRVNHCTGCSFQNQCAGPGNNRKHLLIAKRQFPNIDVRKLQHYHGKKGMASVSNPLTLKMREKLSSAYGKTIYSRRFPSVEGVFGVMKSVRNGWQFFRRTLKKAQVDWAERCIAHNIAKLISFRRVNV
jgi:transposase